MKKAKTRTVKPEVKRGAPEKITPEITQKIADFIEAGAWIETAVALAGIHKDTFYAWLKKGASEESGPYKDFSDQISKAAAQFEFDAHSTILQFGRGVGNDGKPVWQALAWVLERKYPKRYGRRESLRIEDESESKTRNGNIYDEVLAIIHGDQPDLSDEEE